jgi:hypothetical protein
VLDLLVKGITSNRERPSGWSRKIRSNTTCATSWTSSTSRARAQVAPRHAPRRAGRTVQKPQSARLLELAGRPRCPRWLRALSVAWTNWARCRTWRRLSAAAPASARGGKPACSVEVSRVRRWYRLGCALTATRRARCHRWAGHQPGAQRMPRSRRTSGGRLRAPPGVADLPTSAAAEGGPHRPGLPGLVHAGSARPDTADPSIPARAAPQRRVTPLRDLLAHRLGSGLAACPR